MTALQHLGVFFWQTTLETSASDIHWIMIAEVAIAIILVLVLLAALIAGLIVYSKVNKLIDDAKKAALPAIAKGTELFNELTPKVRNITSNVEQISFTARAKADEIGDTVSQINRTVVDVNGKARVQADRVHGMVTDALTTTHEVSQAVQQGVRVPIRKIAGLVTGLKVGLEHLIERSPFASHLRKEPKKTEPYDL